MPQDRASIAVIRRLPRYLRHLEKLLDRGIERVSSAELAKDLGVTASQIRQDLNCFGGFGQQGYGYQTQRLCESISEILGLGRGFTAVLIGAGNLGRALLGKFSSSLAGLTIIGAFDIAPSAHSVSGIRLYHMDELGGFLAERKPHAAILTLPEAHAPEIAGFLQKAGVKAIWNFTGADLRQYGMIVENVPLSDSMMTLSYRLSNELD